jgi:hypothetical protein
MVFRALIVAPLFTDLVESCGIENSRRMCAPWYTCRLECTSTLWEVAGPSAKKGNGTYTSLLSLDTLNLCFWPSRTQLLGVWARPSCVVRSCEAERQLLWAGHVVQNVIGNNEAGNGVCYKWSMNSIFRPPRFGSPHRARRR